MGVAAPSGIDVGLVKRARRASCRSSIREFISRESPVRGIDGLYRERQRDCTVEAVLLALGEDEAVCPGVQVSWTAAHKAA